jgi:hypothetical protein
MPKDLHAQAATTWVYHSLVHLPREEEEVAAAEVEVLRPEVEAEVEVEAAEVLHHSEVEVEEAAAAVGVGVQSQNHSVGEEAAVQTEALFFQAEAVRAQLDGQRGEAAVEAERVGRLRWGVKMVRVVALEAVGPPTCGKGEEVHAEAID